MTSQVDTGQQDLPAIPRGPTPIGLDISCIMDIDEHLSLVYDDKVLLVQAIFRRLSTPRGSMIENLDYGLDLRGMMNAGFTQRTATMITRGIKAEVEKDERVYEASVQISGNGASSTMNVKITLRTIFGVVPMYLAVSDVSVELLRGEAGLAPLPVVAPDVTVSPIVLIGPTGATGATGATGPAGADGSAATVTFEAVKLALASGNDVIDFNGQELRNIGASTTATSAISQKWLSQHGVVTRDSTATISWDLDEPSTPFANEGTAGVLSLTTTGVNGTGCTAGAAGLFGNCAVFTSSGGIHTAATAVGESSDVSVSFWVYLTAYNESVLLAKRTSTTSYPGVDSDMCFYITQTAAANGTWQVQIFDSGAGSGETLYMGNPYTNIIPLNEWTLIGATYEYSTCTLTAYRNGEPVEFGNYMQASLNWGSHGRWMVGGDTNLNTKGITGKMSQVRVYNELKDASFFASLYALGVT